MLCENPKSRTRQLVDCSDTVYKGRTPDSRFLSFSPSRREERKEDNEGPQAALLVGCI